IGCGTPAGGGGSMAFEDDRGDLIRKLDLERTTLIAALQEFDDESASRPAPNDEWSVKQQLAHLATTERLYAECVRRAVSEDGADTSALWPTSQEPTDFTEAQSRPLADLTADVAAARQETLELVAGLQPGDWDKRGANTPFGDLTVGQFLKSLYRHDRMHIDQISGREPSFKPRLTDPNRMRL
ncbi:MAG TPA: DinB family protein, partial [Dehalococcoidia bacterium]|nr:DinB family protein [Dehalococcoidia bacterium]